MKTILLAAVALSFAGSAWAQTAMYVTDETKVPVRTGTSTQHRILRMIPSGVEVTVIEQSKDGYTRVRTPDGTEGWILSRQLMDSPSARDRLAELQGGYEVLETESTQLKDRIAALENDKAELEALNSSLSEKSRELSGELERLRHTAARPLEISKQNQYLEQQLREERETVQQLRNDNMLLKSETQRKWFLTGASVTLGSLFLGLIIPRIPWRRRRGWSEL